jgi:hypothetical protein
LIGSGVVQLFVDDNRVDAMQNIRRTYHSVEKHPANPVIRKVEPWETERGTWGSIIYDQEEKIFKAWYGGESGRQKESIPGSLSSCHVLCYATSRDGVHWDRPRLGMYDAFGTKENNVVIGDDHNNGHCHWESLHKDPFDPNPARRYKAIGWSSYDWNGEQWSVPINAFVSKLLKIAQQPVSIGGGVRYWAESPESGPEGFGGRLIVTFLFPK